jgi:hypothetical protein
MRIVAIFTPVHSLPYRGPILTLLSEAPVSHRSALSAAILKHLISLLGATARELPLTPRQRRWRLMARRAKGGRAARPVSPAQRLPFLD